MSETIHIAVVEDNAAYARSIQDIIECSDGLQLAALFTTAEECSTALQEIEKEGKEPDQAKPLQQVDIILLDLKLPGKGGMTLIPALREHLPDSHILILTHNDDYRAVLEAIQLGVAGYILKDAPVAELRRAIAEVHKGGCVIDPQLSRYVLKALGSGDQGDPKSDSGLSQRERQVLELMAMGHVKKEVADQLGLSYSAVALYTANIYQKLQVPNIAAAVATAIRKGLI